MQGSASFGQIITRDRYSRVHLIMAGRAPLDAAAIMTSQRLRSRSRRSARSYDHVIIDAGAAGEVALERFANLAPRAVLVAPELDHPATTSVRERLLSAGFAKVSVLVNHRRCPDVQADARRPRRDLANPPLALVVGGLRSPASAGYRRCRQGRSRPSSRACANALIRNPPTGSTHAPQAWTARPYGSLSLIARFTANAAAEGGGGQASARRERQEAVEQRLRLAAEERLVVRATDADVEAAHAAIGAVGDHVRQQDQARAVARDCSPTV